MLGLGPSAASFIGERRLRNARSLADWRAALARGESPAVEDEPVTEAEARREHFYLGLRRLDGRLARRLPAPLRRARPRPSSAPSWPSCAAAS